MAGPAIRKGIARRQLDSLAIPTAVPQVGGPAQLLADISSGLGSLQQSISRVDEQQVRFKAEQAGREAGMAPEFERVSGASVYAQIANTTAEKTFFSRERVATHTKVAELQLQNESDPTGYAAAVAGFRRGRLEAVTDPFMRQLIADDIDSTAAVAGIDVQEKFNRQQKNEQEVVARSAIDSSIDNMVKAAHAGLTDQAAYHQAQVDSMLEVNAELFTPEQTATIRNERDQDLRVETELGKLDAAEKIGGRAAVAKFAQGFAENPPASLRPNEARFVRGQIETRLGRLDAQARQGQVEADKAARRAWLKEKPSYQALQNSLREGLPIEDATVTNRIKALALTGHDDALTAALDLEMAQQSNGLARQIVRNDLDTAATQVTALREVAGRSAAHYDAYNTADKLLRAHREGRKSDPLRLGVEAGLIQAEAIAPFNLSDAGQLEARRVAADEVASRWNLGEISIFPANQARAMADRFNAPETPDGERIDMVKQINGGLSPTRAVAVAAQLFGTSGQDMSWAISQHLDDGKTAAADARLARFVAGATKLKTAGEGIKRSKAQAEIRAQLGNMFQLDATQEQRTIDAAMRYYAYHANAEVIDVDDVDKTAMTSAIDDAIGPTVDFRDQRIPLPRNWEKEAFQVYLTEGDYLARSFRESGPYAGGMSEADVIDYVRDSGSLLPVGGTPHGDRVFNVLVPQQGGTVAPLMASDGSLYRLIVPAVPPDLEGPPEQGLASFAPPGAPY